MEIVLSQGLNFDKIANNRSHRNKSSYVWKDNEHERIKIEIGSLVKPEPCSKKSLKTYIQEYLEIFNRYDVIEELKLKEITLYVLDISRTFIDKVFAVKKYSLTNQLIQKTRHIYDVVKLYYNNVIQQLLIDVNRLKAIISLTKEAEMLYKNYNNNYHPFEKYNFEGWKHHLNNRIKSEYENLHNVLLYEKTKQDFDDAIKIFSIINEVLNNINE